MHGVASELPVLCAGSGRARQAPRAWGCPSLAWTEACTASLTMQIPLAPQRGWEAKDRKMLYVAVFL